MTFQSKKCVSCVPSRGKCAPHLGSSKNNGVRRPPFSFVNYPGTYPTPCTHEATIPRASQSKEHFDGSTVPLNASRYNQLLTEEGELDELLVRVTAPRATFAFQHKTMCDIKI